MALYYKGQSALKRVISVLLTLSILACMVVFTSACEKEQEEFGTKGDTIQETDEAVGMRIPYSREDGMNPFAAKTLLNNALMPIVYSGLFSVSEAFEIVPDIASGYEVDSNTLIVTLGSKRFSDGTVISADDVVYSYNKAKASSCYSSALTFFLGVSAANSKTVVFEMSFKNIYAAACLTFPIVKQNSAEGDSSLPIGTGRYTYDQTTDGGVLLQNTQYSSEAYLTDEIKLVNVPSDKSLMHSLVIDNFDAVYDDLSDGTSQRINASMVQVPTNNLVYLGFNQNAVFADVELRKYISGIIDRSELVSSGLEGYGIETVMPFNPKWYAASDVNIPKYNVDDATKYLSTKLSGRTLNILVNSDNNFKVKLAETLCNQLEEIGVSTTLTSVTFDIYTGSVAGGFYDIYIGEYKLTNDMNISGLLADEAMLTSYAEMLAGNMEVDDFMNMFYDNAPFAPVAFRTGVLAYSRAIETEVSVLAGNPFVNIYDWFI